jgi:hypothetical protein
VTTAEGSPPAEGNRRGASSPEGAEHLDLTSGFDRCSCVEATAWRMLAESPHILDLLAEWAEWTQRKVVSETSAQLSAAGRWSGGTSYAELRRRRRLTGVERCGACGAQVELELPLPRWQFDLLPDTSWVRCSNCQRLDSSVVSA